MGDGARTIRLRVTCQDLPTDGSGNGAFEFGLQDKKQALALGVTDNDGTVHYDLTLEATRGDGSPAVRFRGPYVHGTSSAPFLYLSLRQSGAGPNDWIRRLKIPLKGIDWSMVEAVSKLDASILAATVSGQRSGTVPLLNGGWYPVSNPTE